MPPPSSRRSNVRRAGSSVARGPKAEEKPKTKAATEEMEVVEVEAPAEAPVERDSGIQAAIPEADPNVSGRRNASRSKRSGVVSGRASGVSKGSGRSKRIATPEEQAARRQAIRTILTVAAGVALVVIVVVVLVTVVFKKDPQAEQANTRLAEVASALPSIDTRAEFADATSKLAAVPDLPAFAARKAALKKQLADLEGRVTGNEREARVAENLKSLQARLGRLGDPELDLEKLDADCQAFIANPVDPAAAADSAAATTFSGPVAEVQQRLAGIAAERVRRDAAATTGAVQGVQLKVEGLIKEEKFAEARTLIDDQAAKFPKADFGRVRSSLNDAAASAWTSVEGYVKNRYADYETLGIPQSARQKALEDARARLDGVINGWGLDDYVAKAKALREKH